ncbi:MAG TPA: D-alanyl-D-alanine carboxypeptidase/D-alanyl-D-alanine-endopeptidase [Methylophilaceae bacterium]|nr:D-alanyl-D-alanine carboxypeptidase/D-alanyl-D-alanine-endopeptidase [Methylophilaceae bacterium]
MLSIKISCRVLCLAFLLSVTVANAQLPDSVNRALEKAGVPPENVAVYVQKVDAAQPLINHHADQAFSPASVMKVLTTYAALDMLGPAYRWRTAVYHNGLLKDGILDGDLIIQGSGDPYFRNEDLWQLLGYLRQRGIREIRGDLVLDSSLFQPVQDDPGAFDGERYRAYNALPSGWLLNFKSTSFRLVPDAQQKRVDVLPNPDVPEIRVDNKLKLAASGACGDWKQALQYEIQPIPLNPAADASPSIVLVSFKGSYAASCGERTLELSLLGDSTYTLSVFRKIWQQLGGTFNGSVRWQSTPSSAVLLTETWGIPLSEIVRHVNKYSNNLMTRQLLLTIAAERRGSPATEMSGVEVIQAWLASRHMNFPELMLENGSGLSRIERISAAHLARILVDAYYSPVMPEFMSSLPVLAVDGTLSSRLKSSAVKGMAHIKTGSLENVRAMAGYVLDQTGQRWVVVFMANHQSAWATGKAQDALIEWVHGQHKAACCTSNSPEAL